MITPEDTGSDEGRRQTASKAGFLGIVTVAALAGLIAIGVLTSPGPAAIEGTTTTTAGEEVDPPTEADGFRVDQITTGEPLDWGLSMAIDDGYPLELTDHGGAIYLFATSEPGFPSYGGAGMRAWRSIDGVSWDPLGQVLTEEHQISGVTSTGQGLVALEPSDSGSGFTVWRSDNGRDWTAEAVPVGRQDSTIPMFPRTAGGTEDVLVVSGDSDTHVSHVIQSRLEERYPALDAQTYHWTTDILGDSMEITIVSHAGFQLGALEAEDLGLTDDKHAILNAVYRGGFPISRLWTRDGSGWHENEIPDFDLTQAIDNPEGGIVAVGYGSPSVEAWSTEDGSTWNDLESILAPGPDHLDIWGDTIVGPSSSPAAASVVAGGADDGWQEIGPAQFPGHIPWTIGALGAGPGGIAASVSGWGRPSARRVAQDGSPSVTRDVATLTLDYETDEYILEVDGSRFTWWMMEPSPEGIRPDLETGTITFHHPDSGDLLASFGLEDIHQAYVARQQDERSGPNHRALIFTADGSEWTIQDLAPLGGEARMVMMEMTRSHVVAVRMAVDSLSRPLSPGFEIWSAEIPQ